MPNRPFRLCIVASNFSESVPVPGRTRTKPRIALVWTQFLPCHIDRVIELTSRLADRADIVAVEMASTSQDYIAFAGNPGSRCPNSYTLFPGRTYEDLGFVRRLAGLWKATRGCRIVCIGIPHSNTDVVVLAWLLRLAGRRAILMIDTKFDDRPRKPWFELVKRIGLAGFRGAIAASSRSIDYIRFLGFRHRILLPGCATLSIERLRVEAAVGLDGQTTAFADRPFVFVGRLVKLKNLETLLEAFAKYRARTPNGGRKLILVGSGPNEQALRDLAGRLEISAKVEFIGFQSGPGLAARIASSLALVLPSFQETWGLVINEALALGIPVIVSNTPGARDLLVRNLINGFVIENGSVEGFAEAMLWLDRDEELWKRMAVASLDRAPLGDVSHFADAIEVLLDPGAEPAAARMAQHLAELDRFRGYPG